ncbi:hypothetical protein OB955_05280 [Halobacteria archaeon AArc-m2/3/4]|uniref:Uncharacterized protein n=1 Tax=Natronoglomus mannanivorans TaxID=2979990 RepID=A0ABT2QB60_9EURY|nr:hypothetical protein [Halobacteria archaeon AArc-m2/3/4]
MTTPKLRMTVAALTVVALLGGVAVVSGDDGDVANDGIEWIHEMHDRVGMADHDHGEHHDDHDPGEHHAAHEPGEHHGNSGHCK